MKKSIISSLVAFASLGLAVTVQAATYIWTGNGDLSDWEDSSNWDATGVPNGQAGQLSTASASDIVIFDSETATGMPSVTIPTRSSFTGSFKNPQIQVLNGTVNFGTTQNWGWSGIDTFVVGDGDMTTIATAITSYTSLNRDPNGLKTYVVNADGILQTAGITSWTHSGTKDAVVQLNGGLMQIGGTIAGDFISDTDDFVSFNSSGSRLTADFGGLFADLTAVTDQFGGSFVVGTGLSLEAVDNGNGSFTITAIPEPSSFALGAAGLMALLRRRRH
jgi:uncharacterized protein (TIGR03382 family)